jgi:hypothetical protein
MATVLEAFVHAVKALEDAIERRAPIPQIAERDAELATRLREVIGMVENLRSRRIA